MSHSAPVTHNKDFLGCQGLNWRIHNITDLDDLALSYRQDGALVYFSPNDDKHAALWDAQREELRRLEFAPELIPVELIADNQVLDCLRDKCFSLSSDELTDPTLRKIVLSPGGQPGQRIILSWAGPGVGQLVDGSTVDGTAFVLRLSGDWTPAVGDSIALLDTGGDYYEIGRGGPSGTWPGEAADYEWTGEHTFRRGLFAGFDTLAEAEGIWGSPLEEAIWNGGSVITGEFKRRYVEATLVKDGAWSNGYVDGGIFDSIDYDADSGIANIYTSGRYSGTFSQFVAGTEWNPTNGLYSYISIDGWMLLNPAFANIITATPVAYKFDTSVALDSSELLFNLANNAAPVMLTMGDGRCLMTEDAGASVPDDTAILELKSLTKGFLPPRMTKAQRDAIASPADGLTLYQTDNTPGLRVRENGAWVKYSATADP